MTRRAIPGQLTLDDLPAPARRPSTATTRRHRTHAAHAARQAHQRALQWHAVAADFFRGLV